jgi:ribosomal protein L37AE/L43A
MSKCPNCGAELRPLVPGSIYECPKCKTIVQEKKKEEEKPSELSVASGEWFMRNTKLNEKYELCEQGVIAHQTPKMMIAALICHSPDFPKSSYIRLSWFKDLARIHWGMIKIRDKVVLNNTIRALEKIDENFDEEFNWIGEGDIPADPELNDTEFLHYTIKDKKCPVCGKTLKKRKKFYECENQVCGELFVIVDGIPLFDSDSQKLPLRFVKNLPITYYLPVAGITTQMYVGDWKAIAVIYKESNPERKWLRFYWWTRNLQPYITSELTIDIEANKSLAWSSRRGVKSPNIYDKSILKPLINALKKIESIWG